MLELFLEPFELAFDCHFAVVEQQCVLGLAQRAHLACAVDVVALNYVCEYVVVVGVVAACYKLVVASLDRKSVV